MRVQSITSPGPGPSPNQSPLRLLPLAILLASCAGMTESRSGGVQDAEQEQAQSAAQPAPAAQADPQQQGIAVLPAASNAAQLELIEEINRDGARPAGGPPIDIAPQPVDGDAGEVVELNYEQADLRLVLEELAESLDISLVIDPEINQTVSLRTAEDRPLSREDIWPLMRLLTRDAGVVINRVGNVYNVRQVSSPATTEFVTPDSLDGSSAARIMQVTPLIYVSAEAAIQVIQPLLQSEGDVRQFTINNTLAISAGPQELERINQLLLLVDADPFLNQGIRVYPLENANALEVAEELAEILGLIEGENPSYQVRGIGRINALLVTAPATRGFDEVSRWVEILDAESQEQVEQLFMYRVKNLPALELAETLGQVFEEEDEAALPSLQPQDDGLAAIERQVNLNLVDNTEDSDGEAAAPVTLVASELAPPAAGAAPAAVSANLQVRIVADEATNSLLIRASARDYRQLLTTISQLDVAPLQVMVNAVIAQITLTDETRFGVDWSRVADNADLMPVENTAQTTFTPTLNGLMFTRSFLDGAARVEATLEAIAQNNEVRLLARPSLMVTNNQEGEIQIGAEVPIEQGQSIGTGGFATTNIQYRPTGIELYITPQINEDGVVTLTIRQVLSSVDSAASGVNNNPVFNNQEISTTVVVNNGENVVLGGLIQDDNENLNRGVPLLNQVPVIGNLFSYQRLSVERRELFIVLRPEIVNLNAEGGGVQYSDILNRFELVSQLFEDMVI
ncbi:MAG: type II secretion system protein GspD [Gammaproteobacteria bacterium]|nr:type II secretion system protein GspD [Gammaproteobacteria bacterium]MYG95381.1 type II secretion system protein GspD [Gammaproteobacteria bacterium]